MKKIRKIRSFKQLRSFDRDRMEALLNQGHNQSEVALILKVDKGTISRERNRERIDGYYDALVAQHKTQIKRSNSKYQGMKVERHPILRTYIISELKSYQSPDAIAGRMKEEKWKTRVSADAIYRWLRSPYGQRYCTYLCTKRYKKKPQAKADKRQNIPNMKSIHDLPPNSGILTEGDTFLSPRKVSKAGAVLVVWKESKLIKGGRVKSLRSIYTKRVMKKIHSENKSDLMILDRGTENQQHEQFGVETYFCDPASPRQKPLVENSIGLVRRWFYPKGTNLCKVTDNELQEKFEILNNKYRKTLGYRSPNEVARESGIIE